MLDVFTFIVFGILIAAAIFIIVKLGTLPGVIARKRDHPHADAIYVAGWCGLLLAGVLWPLALVWAYWTPSGVSAGAGETDSLEVLRVRVDALEAQVRRLGTKGGAAS